MDTCKLKTNNLIVIVGLSATGKSTFAETIAAAMPDHKVIHTDDYLQFPYERQPHSILHDLYNEDKVIVEGILGYRLLKLGVWEDCFYPDAVVHCVATTQTRAERYKQQREQGFNTTMDAINLGHWRDYIAMVNKKKPKIIEYTT